MNDNSVIALHQHCVLEAFARNAKNAQQFDPNLLDKSVNECENVLEPLRRAVLERTNNPRFAEAVLQKLRGASKRGAAVALAGYLVSRGN